MLVLDTLTRAGNLLQDVTGTRWPTAELLQWLNDGQRETVMLCPNASVRNEALLLVANSTKQTLPVGGIRLQDVTRNMGIDGLTPGKAVRYVEREVMDSTRPSWHSEPGQKEAKQFVFDPRDPKHFYIYPRPHATIPVYVETIYTISPADVVPASAVATELVAGAKYTITSMGTTTGAGWILAGAVTGVVGEVFTANGVVTGAGLTGTTGTASYITGSISLDDIYANALLDYIMYRGFSKDAAYAGAGNRAAMHYQAFAMALGIKVKVESKTQPAAFAPPHAVVTPKTGETA